MKSSVCCTTQNRSFGLLLLLSLIAAGPAWVSRATAQAIPDDVERPQPALDFPALSEAVTVNSLDGKEEDGKEKPPYHLKLSFQIFDMSGKAQEEGTLEGWWAGADGSYLEVSSPSIGTVRELGAGSASNQKTKRSLYLIAELLNAVRTPYGPVPQSGKPVTFTKTEAQVHMDCMYVEGPGMAPGSVQTACTDETKTIRLITQQSGVIVRNRTGKFGSTRVALDVQVVLAGRLAIRGKVEELKGFKPSQVAIALKKPSPPPTSPATPGTAVGVLAGSIIHKVNPIYPMAARQQRISGSVVLLAKITTAGTIADLTPIATGDQLLTGAAIDAVKQWTYRPYLLNGTPTEVNTTITVNFNMTTSTSIERF